MELRTHGIVGEHGGGGGGTEKLAACAADVDLLHRNLLNALAEPLIKSPNIPSAAKAAL